MITRVKIVPRMAIHSLANGDKWMANVKHHIGEYDNALLISINGSDEHLLTPEQEEELHTKHKFRRIVSYIFDDIGGEIWEKIIARGGIDRSSHVEFQDEQGVDMLEKFVEDCNSEDELLVVHCHAGISRSSAVGFAIACHMGLDSSVVISENPNCDPNKHILSRMLKILDISPTSYNLWLNSGRTRKRLDS